MTWSAPSVRTRSTFPRRVLHTPVTSAPRALAICTANVPTPPDAPVIRTVCPGCTLAMSRSACRAVKADIGTAAACSMVRLAGFGAKLSAGAHAYSARVPVVLQPNTSSPSSSPCTFLPTASTRPATSAPGTPLRGRRSPNARRRTYGTPVIGHEEVVARVDSSRMHAHEHVVIVDHRLGDLRVLEHVGSAVAVLNDGHHRGCRRRASKPDRAGVLVKSGLVLIPPLSPRLSK